MLLPESHLQDAHTISSNQALIPFQFDRERIIRLLLQVTGILVVIHLINLVSGGPSWQLERLFALGEENNIPTWFSSLLWGLTAFVAYQCSKRVESKELKRLWILFAIGLLSFSIDEVAMIHESLFEVMGRYFPESLRSEILPHFKATNWPIIAVPFLVLALTFLFWVLMRVQIFQSTGKLIVFGLLAVIVGGYGLEMTTNFLDHNELQWLWEIESVFEESMEMIGAIMILSGLIIHYEWLNKKVKVGADSAFQNRAEEVSYV